MVICYLCDSLCVGVGLFVCCLFTLITRYLFSFWLFVRVAVLLDLGVVYLSLFSVLRLKFGDFMVEVFCL